MRIAFIQDRDPMVDMGGAELTDKTHILAGIRRGHDIQIVIPALNLQELEQPWDLAIMSNSMSLGPEAYEHLAERGVPYVLFMHDYGPQLCKWRLLYSMEDRCRDLCYLRERWLPWLQRAALIIWLSPLHREAWLFAYPQLREHPFTLVPSPVNPDLFYDLHLVRKGVVAVNSSVSYKGAEHVERWAQEHPDSPITLVGGNPENRTLPANVTLQGQVAYHNMNEIYNRHEMFLHLAANVMPFDRVCAEAALAGCRLILNQNVGAGSWPFMHQGRDAIVRALRAAPGQFWAAIEEAQHTKAPIPVIAFTPRMVGGPL